MFREATLAAASSTCASVESGRSVVSSSDGLDSSWASLLSAMVGCRDVMIGGRRQEGEEAGRQVSRQKPQAGRCGCAGIMSAVASSPPG